MANAPPVNALSGAVMGRIMAASLPPSASDAPQLKTAVDAVALASHSSMISVGFRLVGLGEDHKIEAHSDKQETQPLPAEWNAHSGSYAFRYKHSQSSMEYLLKINKMGNKATIMGMGMGEDKVSNFDVRVDEYVSDGNLPFTLAAGEDQGEAERRLQNVFINVGRLSDLGSLIRVYLIQKLVPGLQKEGYQETQTERQPTSSREDNQPRHDPLRDERDPPARPYPLHDPPAQPLRPRGPMPEPIPGFEDEFEIQRPYRGGGPRPGFGNIGERDLYPQGLGPNDPMRGGIGPGLGGFGGGGMHPTFDDPMFGGAGGRGGRGGFDPQAPPGARWEDPNAPGIGGHPRGAGMGGRPPNPFGGFGGGDFI